MTIDELKDQISVELEKWYTADCNVQHSEIYARLTPGKRKDKLVATGEADCPVANYVENYLMSNRTIIISVGSYLYASMVVNDIMSEFPQKYLRRFLKKIQEVDRNAPYVKLRPWFDAIQSSMHDKLREIRTTAFIRENRPTMSCLQLYAERHMSKPPFIRTHYVKDPQALWSAVPVRTLIELQRTVFDMATDVQGYGLLSQAVDVEKLRLERIAKIFTGHQAIDSASLMPNVKRLGATEINDAFGISHEEQESTYGRLNVMNAVRKYTADTIKKVRQLETDDGPTPWTLTVRDFTDIYIRVNGNDTLKQLQNRCFNPLTFAVIIHDLLVLTEEYQALYGPKKQLSA